MKAAVEAVGSLELWKLAIKPGKPFASGKVRDTQFFGLPGNPVSAFVTFVLLVKPDGIENYAYARQILQQAGFDAGYDVLPADQQAIDLETGAGIE